jgi:lysophospholipase L1-like esterase
LKVRFFIILILFALLLILCSFLTSESDNGVVLGRWSVPLALASLILLLTCGAAVRVILGSKKFIVAFEARLSGISGYLSSILLLFPLPVLLTVWFLFPFPIFQNNLFTAGMILLSVFPGFLVICTFPRKKLKSVIQGTVIMFVTLAGTLLISEFLLRKIMPSSIFNPRFNLRPYQHFNLEVDLPGVAPGGVCTTNSWGMRGEEPPEEWDDWLTIVTVGGSTTANYYLDDSLTWSNILQNRLREIHPETWVGNCGIPMHSAAEHALLVREVLSEVKPDIALFLVGINDVGQFVRGENALNSRLSETGLRQALFRNSMILQTLYKLKVVYIDKAPVVSESVDPLFVEEPLSSVERELPDDIHELLPRPDEYANRIESIIRACREQDITPVFLTQPLLYDDTDYWRGIRGGSYWFGETDAEFSAASHWIFLNTLNQDLIRVCETEGVAYFDLASRLPHSRDVFYDCMHMTEYGAALAGDEIADYLIEENILRQ